MLTVHQDRLWYARDKLEFVLQPRLRTQSLPIRGEEYDFFRGDELLKGPAAGEPAGGADGGPWDGGGWDVGEVDVADGGAGVPGEHAVDCFCEVCAAGFVDTAPASR